MALEKLTTEQRVQTPYHHIDPGFINPRVCFSTFGDRFIELFESEKRPGEDHFSRLANNHWIVDLVLKFCQIRTVPSLGEVLADPAPGKLWCSTEQLEGNPDVYDKPSIRNRILLPYDCDWECVLDFHTSHIVCDTGKLEQERKSKVAIVAGIDAIENKTIVSRPLIMGAPSYVHSLNKDADVDLTWHGWDWYQICPHDIAEFSKMQNVAAAADEWMPVMSQLSEDDVKRRFCDLLGQPAKKDWGGELCDHFGTVQLAGRPVDTAFLFKGPAQFREMTPDILGKRADQIFRLASTPARLLVVQHCHLIGEAVRASLRAFSVKPSDPRQYCFIDGRDTYRIFKAYEKI